MTTLELIISKLHLVPLPEEGGYFVETYRSPTKLTYRQLPSVYTSDRCLCTAIYYLLTPETFSALHKLPGDEIYHFYLGDPVEMLQLKPDGSGELITIGSDVASGMVPQVIVSGGVWQGSKLKPGGKFALMGTTMSPGFEFADYVGGWRKELTANYPSYQQWINELTRK